MLFNTFIKVRGNYAAEAGKERMRYIDFDDLLESIRQQRFDNESMKHFRTMWLPRAVLRIARQEEGRIGRRLKFGDYEDITHRVFEIVLRKTPPDKEGDAYRAWICQTIAYVSKNKLRRENPIPIDMTMVETLLNKVKGDARSGLSDVQLEKIEEAVNRLPHNQRKAIILRYWRGYSSKETAVHLNCSGNQVDQWVYRARQTLAETLAAYFPQYDLSGRTADDETGESDTRNDKQKRWRNPNPPTLRERVDLYGSPKRHGESYARNRIEAARAPLYTLESPPQYSVVKPQRPLFSTYCERQRPGKPIKETAQKDMPIKRLEKVGERYDNGRKDAIVRSIL
ncbi:sigma-70 family RNA polymerase sigma factor [Paenibacillus mesophilus]|uniref:RNA polymerase sigma factor n=1 Tax=Paenibacillus mesophilus TaxID=2582849 RepID=UPI00110D738E|nr:sigma-70 family RNA polymerase sigma factor [Paenibacillus mesophilus]TMV46614.1 sigma-70 family RNA polymerase sigma factor [Paenibacillus mesophilus]